jgi:hypothetical protein
MAKPFFFRPVLATALLTPLAASAWFASSAPAAPQRASQATRLAAVPRFPRALPPSNKYVPLANLKSWQQKRARAGDIPGAALQPMVQGRALKVPMRDLLSGPAPDFGAKVPTKQGLRKVEPKRFAQAFPRPVAPASPGRFPRVRSNVVPKWVRYPLEFQLAGIGIGTRAVDKDRFNRIDRYGLFALHGNPTAVVRAIPQAAAAGGEAGGAAAGGAPPAAAPGGAPGGEGAATAAPANANLTLFQQPPELATLFPSNLQGGLPAWALAVTVELDNNHVQWIYKRDTYVMGFVVDRLGFVDAIIVAGLQSDIARTQLEDPIHTVKLGDDFRKVTFRYGYPDDIVPLAADPAAVANSATGAVGGGGGGAAGDNAAYRTFDMRYEQSYNVVFTIRNNRVVRIYIFGDPDFFNAQRRNQLRTRY